MDHATPPTAPLDVDDAQQELEAVRAALRASREREALLRDELAHRVRNILGMTRSIFTRTLATAATLDHANDHFIGRLDALSRYHAFCADVPHAGFDLEAMIYDELMVFRAADDPRVEVTGPAVRLHGRAAETLGLALHELATNALKFGALSDANGHARLRIGWTADHGVLDLRWEESGVAIVSRVPVPNGFGRQYIEQALPYQLGGETRFTLVPGGVACRIRIPLKPGGEEAGARSVTRPASI